MAGPYQIVKGATLVCMPMTSNQLLILKLVENPLVYERVGRNVPDWMAKETAPLALPFMKPEGAKQTIVKVI